MQKAVILMRIKYDIERIKAVIDDICSITGISIAVSDTKYNEIYSNETTNDTFCHKILNTKTGEMRCHHSDRDMLERCTQEKKPISHTCHAGVLDTVVPILKDGFVAGYIMLGRVRLTKNTNEIKDLLHWAENPAEIVKYYKELTYLSEDQMNSIIHLISHILFENAVEIDYDEFINYATDYIENNLAEDLSVKTLCKALHVSKNVLYQRFNDVYSCTVNEYITKRRLRRAEKLLRDTDKNIAAISEAVGFYNYTYFSKLFKANTGMTPSEYRKSAKA